MAQHPLAALRASVGLSHAAYAQLVADAHAALGFGPLAARREKVARWESGRTVPSPTTQLAIAHVHGVPESDVALLGWPMWLNPAGRAAASAEEQPWTAKGAVGRAREAAGPVTGNAFRLVLAVSGHALLVQMQKALTALEHPRTAHTQPGHVVPPASLDWAESRLRSLEREEAGSTSAPAALFYAARAEHRLVAGLLADAGYDRQTGTRLLYLAARSGRLCACLSTSLGDFATAERYSLAALHAATTIGARRQSIVCLADLAGLHATAGTPKDALCVVAAARREVRCLTPRLSAQLDSWEGLALARMGDKQSSARALDRAGRRLSTGDQQPVVADGLPVRDLDGMQLRLCTGLSQLYWGRPHEALKWLAPLTRTESTASPDAPGPSPFSAGVLLYTVDAQLALGELDSALRSAWHAVALAGGLPDALAGQYYRRFDIHRGEPRVQDLLSLLDSRASDI
ncbi:helix-turn-helix domain-containing protein [Streptomyces xanthochromogenes]|uniref:helix-turn-helix domain-containing protein n=1 Tax=Streptomyces xanthochromogenes TaxID=67384 RepID=UPI0038217181